MDPDLLTDKEQIERNEQLARDIYPQPQGNSRFFTKAPQHEITLAIERSNEDAAFVVDWLKVWTIGLFAPIPLIIADIVFTAFLQKPSDDESMISAAIVGLPLFVFSLVLVLVLQKFIVPTLDSMKLYGRLVFWSTVIIALPLTQFAETFIVYRLPQGQLPDIMTILLHSAIFIAICAISLASVVYVKYRSRVDTDTRSVRLAILLVLPYFVLIPIALYNLITQA